jgi:copper chaperone NosL
MKLRILLILTSLFLLSSFIFPLWFIKLKAPQYPEGVYLLIYINKLGGQIDLVNALNHYIGMKKIDVNAIPELKFMPLIVIFLSLMGFLSALTKNRIFMLTYLILFTFFAILGLWDFYRWEYEYGHNLSPDAPIKIEPFQPPLIGIKQLLNFTIYSFPHISGWLIILAWFILACVNVCYAKFEPVKEIKLRDVKA